MEFLFKRHFWLVHLAFIFLVTVLVARGGNAFVEAELTLLPAAKARTGRPPVMEQLTALNPEKFAKVTGLPNPKPEPKVNEPAQTTVDLSSEPVRSSLRAKLLGTLLSGIPEWSIASIQDQTTQKTQTYLTDDEVMGAKILEIERTRVIVLNNNRKEYIDGTPGDGQVAVTPPPPAIAAAGVKGDSPPPSVALGQGIKSLNENEYEVPRAEIDKTLSNLNDVAMQARIVPAFKDGAAQGFKLFSIRPDSIYTKIGVQNGDVIKRINGFDLNSPEKALEIYSKLKEASRIDIELDRNGSSVKKTYTIR